MSDADAARGVALEIEFAAPGDDLVQRTIEALRALRLVGHVLPGGAATFGSFMVQLAAIDGRGLLVEQGDAVAVTPAEPVVRTLAARLRAAVVLDADDPLLVDERPADPRADDAPGLDVAKRDAPFRVLCLAGGRVPLAPDRRVELARQIGGDVVVAADGARTAIFPVTDAAHAAYWPRNQRPVVVIVHGPDMIAVNVYTSTEVTRAPLRSRATAGALPDLGARWDPPPLSIGRTAAAVAVQMRLAAQYETAVLGVENDDPDTGDVERRSLDAERTELADAGVDLDRLLALTGRPFDDVLVGDIAAAVGLTSATADVLTAGRAPESLPDALMIRRLGFFHAISAAMFAEPEHSSFWTWRVRTAHRRPRLAIGLAVAEMIAGGLLIAASILPPHAEPLTTLQVVIGIGLAASAAFEGVIIWRARRTDGVEAS